MKKTGSFQKSKIISYAMNLASFLINLAGDKINKIILFGSVVSGEFNKESDIDIFVDSDLEKKEINKFFELYQKTKDYEKFFSIIKNPISLRVGKLEKWTSLKRELISNGLLLYGKYKELPEKLKAFSIIQISAKSINLWRKIYGYKQKVGRKIYISEGIISKLGGRKLTQGLVLIPQEKTNEFLKFLKKNKINYTVEEIWKE
ncbi:MAG: nucleotidyltransferase domain-containing protein [Nanoarchaeota archaeon]|nr:nucleotidyltransferase domain-containing protein [Nanoarchaeota archaeon]